MGSGDYCWVVICKNHRYHNRQNVLVGHHIPLAETDGVSSQPPLPGKVAVRCDDCGREYFYSSQDVLRMEVERPVEFRPHPLFVD